MKKSQTSAGSIAVFIVLIALFMVLYLLFVPPETRNNLLGLNETSDNGEDAKNEVKSASVLLSQEPGLLKPFDTDESEHDIDAVSLYVRDEPVIEDLATSIIVTKTIFSEETRTLKFNIDDLDNLDEVTLFFFVDEADGDLIISLNNIKVFEGKASGIENIILPRDLLKDNNELLFEVSNPSFFGKNTYELSQLKVKQNFELTNTQEERNIILSASETGKGTLEFFVFCNSAPVGSRLRVFANNEEVFNSVLSCIGSQKTVEIDEDILEEGKNILLFDIDKGDFLLNGITLKVELEEGGARTYKFSITEDQMNDILDSAKEVKLTMEFADDESKRATISVNGNDFTLDTEDLDYERFITSLVEEGNNFIRITPDNEFTADLLEIKIVE